MPDSGSDQSMLSSKYIRLWRGSSHRQAARGEYGRSAGSVALLRIHSPMARLFPSASRTWRIRAKCRVCCAYNTPSEILLTGLARAETSFAARGACWWGDVGVAAKVTSGIRSLPHPSMTTASDQWSKNDWCTGTITLQNVALWLSQSWGGGCRAWRVWVRLCTSHSGHSGRLPSIRAVLTRPHVACGWWDAGPEIYAIRGNL